MRKFILRSPSKCDITSSGGVVIDLTHNGNASSNDGDALSREFTHECIARQLTEFNATFEKSVSQENSSSRAISLLFRFIHNRLIQLGLGQQDDIVAILNVAYIRMIDKIRQCRFIINNYAWVCSGHFRDEQRLISNQRPLRRQRKNSPFGQLFSVVRGWLLKDDLRLVLRREIIPIKVAMLNYRGYTASIRIDDNHETFVGKVEGINDLISFEGKDFDGLKKGFENAVDSYLRFCEKLGKDPDKKYSGKISYRTDEATHQEIAYLSAVQSMSINAWIDRAVKDKIKEDSILRKNRILAFSELT